MKLISRLFFTLFLFILTSTGIASVFVGVGKEDITPPIGTPSAGYSERKGQGMKGSHDPLLAIALFIDNGEKQLVLCSVDHLGFTSDMTQEIIQKVQSNPDLNNCEVFISSSHTHAGGGSFLNIPVIGESLAGPYDAKITQMYVDKTYEAILQAYSHQVPAKIGIGYGETKTPLSRYRGLWPKGISPLQTIAIIKITHLDDSPLALLFNYPVHPTVLDGKNYLFSADFVGYARMHLQESISPALQPIYFNGAQGDILPIIFNKEDLFDSCDQLAKNLTNTVKTIWEKTETTENLHIATQKESYTFVPQSNPFGLSLPALPHQSEVNLIVLNKEHAFVTIPGELSCLYDKEFKEIGDQLGFAHLSVFGLTNDAHGYIILPESWQHKTLESGISFGGENYGETIKQRVHALLKANAPKNHIQKN